MIQHEVYDIENEYVSRNFCNYINNFYSILNCNRDTLRIKLQKNDSASSVLKTMYETFTIPTSCRFIITLKESNLYNVMNVVLNIADDLIECLELDKNKLSYKLYYYTNHDTNVVRMEIVNSSRYRINKTKKINTLSFNINDIERINFNSFHTAEHAAYITFNNDIITIKSKASMFNNRWLVKHVSFRKDL